MRSSLKLLLSVGLVGVAGAVGCSSTSTTKADSGMAMDMGPTADAGPTADKGMTGDMKMGDGKAPDAAGPTFSGTLAVVEVSGRTGWAAPGPDAGPPTKFLSVQMGFAPPPSATVKPDFVDNPAPPNCVAYKWDGTGAPSRTTGDGGKVKITGHNSTGVVWVDANATTPTPTPLPATIECNRVSIPTTSLFMYNCGLAGTTVLPAASALLDTSKISIDVEGGKDVAAFSEKDLAMAPVLEPADTFKLNAIDPSAGVTAAWKTTTAPLVAINIDASLKDGSKRALITCTAIAAAMSKAIPKAALDLLPTPTNTNPLIISTSITALSIKAGAKAWGSYTAAIGRGTIGVSCRLASSACP